MKKTKPTLHDSDMITNQRVDLMDKVVYQSKKSMTTAAMALALSSPVMFTTACSDPWDVTTIADRGADTRDVGRVDTGSFADPFDVGRYDVSDRDVTRYAD
jgi:hypothetical protein